MVAILSRGDELTQNDSSRFLYVITTWHENTFRIISLLWAESTGEQWIACHNGQMQSFDVFVVVSYLEQCVE